MPGKEIESHNHCANPAYDALLLVSFGGPEGPDDVMPFLENVVRGKNVPRERLLEVAQHYAIFDGVSPINDENRAMLRALVEEFNRHGPPLAVYWGNRNWHPLLADAIGQMAEDGIQHALAFVTSAFGSYPGCRQYVEDIEEARKAVGPNAPQIDKLRLFYNHPGFIEATAEQVAAAWSQIPQERRNAARLIFTAHSLPTAIAENAPYVHQLHEASRLVAEHAARLLGFDDGIGLSWSMAYQSRSGPPSQPWLEPDVGDEVRRLHASEHIRDVVIAPIGFLVEHMEVVYDLDIALGKLCEELGINMVRAGVAGHHPRFIQMVLDLVAERFDRTAPRLALGADGPWPDECPGACCRRV